MNSISDRIKALFCSEGGLKEILLVAYPLVIMSASHSVMQFFDRMFLAHNSPLDVAAALPAGILSFTLFSFFMVTLNFTSAIVAQYFGSGNMKSCVKAVWNGFYLAVGAALVNVCIMPFIGLALIKLGNHEAEVMLRERQYFLSMLPGTVLICFAAPLFSFFSGQGRTWYVAMINMGGCLMNIILDYLLIFGKFGFPALGITGAGLATSISIFFELIAILWIFLAQDQTKYPTRSNRSFDWNDIKRIFSFGTPAGLQCFFEVGAFTLFAFLMGVLGTDALAATTIMLSINNLSFLPLLGMMDATAILVGQYIGRSAPETSEKVAYRAWLMASCYMLGACALYLLAPHWLIGNFMSSSYDQATVANIMDIGQKILICAAVFNFFDATKFIFMGALRGAGDTKAVLLMSIALNWGLLIPGVLTMIFYFRSPVVHIWMYMTGYLLIECSLFYWRYRCGNWKKIKMIDRTPVPVESEPLNENIPPL